MPFTYHVINYTSNIPPNPQNAAYLIDDNWDDFNFKTLFSLIVFDQNGQKFELGSIKVGYIGQKSPSNTSLPPTFSSLGNGFFSLGQSADYYDTIQSINHELRQKLFSDLKDIVVDEDLLARVREEDVFKTSLLRSVSYSSITGQFKRLLSGGALQTDFHFKFIMDKGSQNAGYEIDFKVDPDDNPSTNMHVLIGRNGVGKTYLLNKMIEALVGDEESKDCRFEIIPNAREDTSGMDLFSGVVSVAFSAFDPFDPIPEKIDKSEGIRYSYVGLKRSTNRGGKKGTSMSSEMVENDFNASLGACLALGRSALWKDAINKLKSDPLFSEVALRYLNDIDEEQSLQNSALKVFKKLSSGHRIVLLTITKLVEKTEEKTLVLLDEPEGHLHPPLLSAFTRAVSDLMEHRNAVAIIATHSPVILQEVPKSCVWKLYRTGFNAKAEPPTLETFGENLSTLTREIFGLEVTESGFHILLKEAVAKGYSYKRTLREFDDQLGYEAQAILRSLISVRDIEDENTI